jgi:transmembrane sensor
MERKARHGFNNQIYEEACEWFMEFRGGRVDAPQRRELDAWLRKSPERLQAYLEIAAIWNDGPALDPTGKWDTETLLAQAADEPDNVVSHPNHAQPRSSSAVHVADRRVARKNGRRFLAIAASLLAVCLVAWIYSQRNVYTTDIGEQRSIRLADGSTVDLNSRSRIEIRYSYDERSIDLLEGQALFQATRDASRPFIVHSGLTQVRAVGTQFDVNRRKAGTVVTVLEGKVAVTSVRPDSPPSERSSSYLSAGEQLRVARGAESHPISANVASATAWRQRQLVFESATLAEVAEEFNRFNERQLVIEDPALYDFHISGVFSSSDPVSLLQFLRRRPGVEVQETGSTLRVTKKSSSER